MNILSKFFAVTLIFATLCTLAAAGYFALRILLALFADLDPVIAKVTAIGSVVVLLGSVVIASAIRDASSKGHLYAIHTQKAAVYLRFLQSLSIPATASFDDSTNGDPAENLAVQLALFGSAAVVKAVAGLREAEREAGRGAPEVEAWKNRLIDAIRKDLGSEAGLSIADDLKSLVVPTLPAATGSVQWLR